MITIKDLKPRAGALYKPNYIEDAGLSLDALMDDTLSLNWITKRTARHEYFMSLALPRKYTYGGGGMDDQTYDAKPYALRVLELNDRLNEDLDAKFNVCFLNKYDDQHQHLGWHADDFPGMDETQPIAVVSFGAEREIWIKPKDQKGEVPKDQRIFLGAGSLFVMPPGFQSTHLHRIPKHHRPCCWRISLTFRSFKPLIV